MSQRITSIEKKARKIDMTADLLKQYWYNTGQQHREIKNLADKLEIMSGKIEYDEFRAEIESEGEKMFGTMWSDFFEYEY